jgi:nicotinic acid phosphoribosyltransferase
MARSTIPTKLKRARSEAVFFIDFSFRFAHHLQAHFWAFSHALPHGFDWHR